MGSKYKHRDEKRKQAAVSFVRAIGLVQIDVRSDVTVTGAGGAPWYCERGAACTLSKASVHPAPVPRARYIACVAHRRTGTAS